MSPALLSVCAVVVLAAGCVADPENSVPTRESPSEDGASSPSTPAPSDAALDGLPDAAIDDAPDDGTPLVTVDLGKPGRDAGHVFGTYASEKTLFVDEIYDPTRTLGPLKMPGQRLQLYLHEDPAGWHSVVSTPSGPRFQEGPWAFNGTAIRSFKGEVFVTLGLPSGGTWSARLGSPDPTERAKVLDDLEALYFDVATQLQTPAYAGSRKLAIELFGEPDINAKLFGPSGTFEQFFEVFARAYRGVARARGANVTIGGSGIAFPESPWLGLFTKALAAAKISVDFVSFHHYLMWTDATDIGGAGADSSSLSKREKLVADAITASGLSPKPKILVSEYGWPDGNLAVATGHDPTAKARTAERTLMGYESCARTLEAFSIALDSPSIERFFWAQGVGDAWIDPIYTYFPVVVYEDKTDTHRYKSSYWALWLHGGMPGTGRALSLPSPRLAGLATSNGSRHRVLIWNRGASAQSFRVAFVGASIEPSRRTSTWLVDSTTYAPNKQFPDAKLGTFGSPEKVTLEHEATVAIEVAAP